MELLFWIVIIIIIIFVLSPLQFSELNSNISHATRRARIHDGGLECFDRWKISVPFRLCHFCHVKNIQPWWWNNIRYVFPLEICMNTLRAYCSSESIVTRVILVLFPLFKTTVLLKSCAYICITNAYSAVQLLIIKYCIGCSVCPLRQMYVVQRKLKWDWIRA